VLLAQLLDGGNALGNGRMTEALGFGKHQHFRYVLLSEVGENAEDNAGAHQGYGDSDE
jgi:hypothetical protein